MSVHRRFTSGLISHLREVHPQTRRSHWPSRLLLQILPPTAQSPLIASVWPYLSSSWRDSRHPVTLASASESSPFGFEQLGCVGTLPESRRRNVFELFEWPYPEMPCYHAQCLQLAPNEQCHAAVPVRAALVASSEA